MVAEYAFINVKTSTHILDKERVDVFMLCLLHESQLQNVIFHPRGQITLLLHCLHLVNVLQGFAEQLQTHG